MRENSPLLVAAALIALGPAAARACPGVGVILRIDGRPADVVIMRAGAPVARPRVLEVICQGDLIHTQNGATVTLSLDGLANVRVTGAPYAVGARRAGPTLAANAYQTVSNRLLPDMKRQPWDVRLRGPGRELGFALPSMEAGKETLVAGARPLLVRLDGGVGAYKVQIVGPGGGVLAQTSGQTIDMLLPPTGLAPGAYLIQASDSSGAKVEAKVTVVPAPPPLSADYAGMADREVQAAAEAVDLARDHPEIWALEAEQLLNGAPQNGLDRESVFELMETYEAPA